MNTWYIQARDTDECSRFYMQYKFAIFLSKLSIFFTIGLVLEKIGISFKYETIIRTMTWELNKTYQLEVMAIYLRRCG